ncbi:MAG: cyclic nucleotide-binding domain-containing protein [Candidatus Wallbacteria bacterium]|nr:cyclic nucleotide-binding domain-containing protein [Candidatus Wallbacteria bacterium]
MNTLEALAGSILCRYIEDEDVRQIHATGKVAQISAGQPLFTEGDEGGSLYVILTGTVDILKASTGGAARKLATLHPGDLIGEISLVDASPRSASAVTASDCTLFEFSRRDLMGIIRSHPGIAAKVLWAMLETVSLRLRDMNDLTLRWNLNGGRDLPSKADL